MATKLGIATFLTNGTGILLPNWDQARQRLVDITRDSPPLEADAPPHAQIWRRIPVGIPGTQCTLLAGDLKATPLAWGPPKRLTQKKKPPQWLLEIFDARPFVRWITGTPAARVCVGQTTLLELLQNGGVASRAQLGHFASATTFQGLRTKRFLTHAQSAVSRQRHLTDISASGMRPICAACSSSGPLTNTTRWLVSPCPLSGGGFDDRPVIRSLEQQKFEIEETLRLLALLT